MPLFGQPSYGMPPKRSGFRTFLMVLAVIFGLYFLNTAFPIVNLPESFLSSAERYINMAAGVLLVLLGMMVVIRQRYY